MSGNSSDCHPEREGPGAHAGPRICISGRITLTVLLSLLLAAPLGAQTPKLHPNAPDNAKPPVITFDFVLPGSNPGYYSLAVDSVGRAAYISQDLEAAGAKLGDPYSVRYVISEPTRARIFRLADQLHDFQGNFEFHGGRIANMGAKTFTWSDGEKQNQTTFNYSANPRMQELTGIFQEIAATMEHGRRLQFLLRFDKLGLDAELKSMQEDLHQLVELQVLEPVLQKIAADPSIMNISRQRAQKLLAVIHSNPALRQVAPQ